MFDSGAVPDVLSVADSYKITHHSQYPEGTSHVYSYFECRGGKYPNVCFFGLQYIIKKWLAGVVVNREMVLEAKGFYQKHFGVDVFNEKGWMYIVEKHGGLLPLRICAVPEGSVVPVKNVLFTVENTDPAVPWLTNWFESASIGGAAHLVNFQGTDTIAGLRMLSKYYDCEMAGFSVPAAEHSTITTWQKSGEAAAYRHMLQQFPTGAVSVVSDSYDIYHAVSHIWGEELKDTVIERGKNGTLVIRPDSGEPIKVVLEVLKLLEEKYPVTRNSKGFKMLPPYLRIIQGDGICYETIEELLKKLKEAGWSTDNVLFGTGAALLQKVNRDTLKCAFKCSHVVVNGEELDVYKDPITDHAKQSKKGRLTLERNKSGDLVTVQKGEGNPEKDLLMPVFENGKLLVNWTLAEIRERAELDIVKQALASEKSKQNGNCEKCEKKSDSDKEGSPE